MLIIPYAIFSLGLNEIAGGYLFLMTALGIGLGSYFAGKAFGDKPNLNTIPFSGGGIVICCVLLQFVLSLTAVVIILVLLGFCGGLYLVPQQTFVQLTSPDQYRSRNIATTNFLSFIGVLLASGLMLLFTSVLQITPNNTFGIIGGIALFFISAQSYHIFR